VCGLSDDDATTDLSPNSSPFLTRFGALGVVFGQIWGSRVNGGRVGRGGGWGRGKLETLVV
jgi:hypothetical protein